MPSDKRCPRLGSQYVEKLSRGLREGLAIEREIENDIQVQENDHRYFLPAARSVRRPDPPAETARAILSKTTAP